ncbi:putative beta-glucosidase G [Fusarium oxysporum]|uniref:Probable beta-glucosidase G n=1 Tax=Fusarium oxysporum TaxID=5507 RepID=A0A420ML94_FUSOX|nr:putative beta-glucosidase G [Fusarium oxysporum]
MHELYMWSFADGIRAGADHAMCSYQLLNQTHACANSKALNGLLKGELGLQGSILSDWFATHSGVSSIDAGLDLNMPGGWASPYFMNMSQYVENGDVSEERLDDMVRRILTPYFRYKQNSPDYPALDLSLNEFKEQETAATGNTILLPATPEEIPMWNIGGTKNRDVRKDHGKFVRELGAAGAVLLKNDADLSQGQFALNPIDPIGPEMGANAQGSGSGTGRFSYFVSPLQAIKERMGSDLVQYILDNKAIASNIGSIYPAPEACLVFVKSHIGEATDRETLGLDWDGNAIIDTVSQKCNNTIVVTHTGGPNNMPWADNLNVTAIIAGHLPGQEIGHSIADILWGDLNPSGKLPYTIAHNESDYNASVVNLTGSTGIDAWQSDFTEGLYTDYRHFNESDIEPLYEFGFGLSYTTFSVKLGSVTKLVRNASPMPLNRPTQPGGNPALFEPLVKVTITVRNTGKLAVATVPQLYLSLPDSAPRGTPVKVLRGFDKTKKLSPNQSQKISFVLTRKDMSFWDVTKQDWLIPKGRFSIKVGFSSRDLPVEGSVVF